MLKRDDILGDGSPRHGMKERAGLEAGRKGPADAGSQAGVAGISPIDVPVRLELDQKAHLDWAGTARTRIENEQFNLFNWRCVGDVRAGYLRAIQGQLSIRVPRFHEREPRSILGKGERGTLAKADQADGGCTQKKNVTVTVNRGFFMSDPYKIRARAPYVNKAYRNNSV
jgi:hypothetical protein